MSNALMVPCSIGEVFDKLTILELKMEFIKDAKRRADVELEYNSLKNIVADRIGSVQFHYDKLLEVNRIMWVIQDKLHSPTIFADPMREYNLMKEINDVNERRFRIKRTLNVNTGSVLKEQKGYAGKRVFICGHQGLGDHFFMNGAVRYMASCYDEVRLVVKKQNLKNVQALYANEPSVTFHEINDDSEISPAFGGREDVLMKAVKGFDRVFMLGYHGRGNVANFPYCFYKDMELKEEILKSWSHIYSNVTETVGEPYLFVHAKASDARAPIQVDPEMMLVICPSENMYPEGHKWWAAAERWVGRPILEYCDVMAKAEKCLLVDSSFFCMSLCLGLMPEVWVRGGRSYKNVCEELVEHNF